MINTCFNESSTGIEITFQSDRLKMQSVKIEDLDNCIALYGDPEVTVYFDEGKPKTKEEVIHLVNEIGISRFQKKDCFGLFSIFDLKKGTFMGCFDILPGTDPGELEIGYIFHKTHYGKGYGTEVAKAIMNTYIPALIEKGIQVNHSSIKTISATAHPENTASWKILERIGMTCVREGLRFGGLPRKYYKIDL